MPKQQTNDEGPFIHIERSGEHAQETQAHIEALLAMLAALGHNDTQEAINICAIMALVVWKRAFSCNNKQDTLGAVELACLLEEIVTQNYDRVD